MLPLLLLVLLPVAWATPFDDDPEGLYRHPLLIGEVYPEVVERLAVEDAAVVLRDVVIYDETIEVEGGAYEQRSVVRFPERGLEPSEAREEIELEYAILHPQVEAWMTDAGRAGTDVDVWITVRLYDAFEPMIARFTVAVAEGRVLTNADAWAVRQELIEERRAAAVEEMAPFVRDLESLGAEVSDMAPTAGAVRVVVDASFLEEVASWADVTSLEPAYGADENDDAGLGWAVYGTNINGYELTDLIQAQQLYDEGYQGHASEVITLAESGGANVRRAHPGFEDVWGSDRFENCPGSSTSCTSNPNPATGDDHATASASVLLGDITRDQDPSVPCTGTLYCEQFSGVARLSDGLGISSSDWDHAHWAATNHSYIFTQSATNDDQDPDCSGAVARTRAWNAMYEDGVAMFNSNGNNEHSNIFDCTMPAPATAMGVFVVAAYDTDPGNSPADAPAISSATSLGGVATDGIRTMYGVAAPNDILYPFNHDGDSAFQYGADWTPADGIPDTFGESSAATPVVAGAAAVYRHWYRQENSALIDDPGILYADLLLMGDRRYSDGGAKMTEGFSPLWGAGALRLRKYDGAGLDAWAQHNVGSVCVGHGTTVVPIATSTAVPADVEYAKAVAWWYDERHDNAGNGYGQFDRVTLRLQRYDTGTSTWVTLRDDADENNMLRVYYSDVGAWELRLQLSGTSVTQDSGGCGTNSVRVYFAWLVEDNDRDDDANLAATVRPEF